MGFFVDCRYVWGQRRVQTPPLRLAIVTDVIRHELVRRVPAADRDANQDNYDMLENK